MISDKNTPYYVGRWFEKEMDGVPHMVTLNDGSIFCFEVTDADYFSLNFTITTGNDIPYFAYSIDGGPPVRQRVDQGIVFVPDRGKHMVRIITDGVTESVGKWNEERGFALKSVTVSEGAQMQGVKPTGKVIYFYGDSITEGIGALGSGYNSEVNSATNAYSWHCAEKLHAVPYIVGYGGTGLTSVGSFNTMENAIKYYSQNRPVQDDIRPDLIIVNHGHNDGGAEESVFQEALIKAIQILADKYPKVPIVYVIPYNQAHASTIVDTLEDMGHNIFVVRTESWNLETVDGAHPSVAGAKLAGDKLSAELIRIFGKDFFHTHIKGESI